MLGAVAGGAGGGRDLGPCGEPRFPALGGRRRAWAESPRPLPPPQITRRSPRRRACTSVNWNRHAFYVGNILSVHPSTNPDTMKSKC